MYSKILIAVDLADEPEQVLKAGKELADTLSAQYHAVYCMEEPVAAFGELSVAVPVVNMTQLKHEVFPHFKEVAESCGIDSQHINIEIGHIGDAIVAKADAEGYDLIIVGSHGKKGLRLLLGSTANSVLHHAKCDVLAVRKP